MDINYILVATILKFPPQGSWLNLEIRKPHAYITECLDEGQRWHEQHIKNNLTNGDWRNSGSVMTWQCVRVAPVVGSLK